MIAFLPPKITSQPTPVSHLYFFGHSPNGGIPFSKKYTQGTSQSIKHHLSKFRIVCAGLAVEEPVPSLGPLAQFINAIFKFQPLWNVAKNVAKKQMVARGNLIGVDWNANVDQLKNLDLDAAMKSFLTPDETKYGVEYHPQENRIASIQDLRNLYPSYYVKPFHSYETGNLEWLAATESISASRTVHSTLFVPKNQAPEPDGDDKLRQNYCTILRRSYQLKDTFSQSAYLPSTIVDIGASSGISTALLQDWFPHAQITGIEPSPYFLAVAKAWFSQEKGYSKINWKRAFGENTGISDNTVDLVTVCLVFHELPRQITGRILAEAFRILRPGGRIAVMEVDPDAPQVKTLRSNPLFLALFKSTEPYIDDYFTLDFHRALNDVGFRNFFQENNSPRHRTMIAFKPQI